MALIRSLAAILLLLFTVDAMAGGIEVREFDDPVMEKRYRDLTASMRCPLCENQAIDDSDAPISADMRDRVYRTIVRISKLLIIWCSVLVTTFFITHV